MLLLLVISLTDHTYIYMALVWYSHLTSYNYACDIYTNQCLFIWFLQYISQIYNGNIILIPYERLSSIIAFYSTQKLRTVVVPPLSVLQSLKIPPCLHENEVLLLVLSQMSFIMQVVDFAIMNLVEVGRIGLECYWYLYLKAGKIFLSQTISSFLWVHPADLSH